MLPEVIMILKTSFLTPVTQAFQTYIWFNVALKDIMFNIYVDPSQILCNKESAILLLRNEHIPCEGRFKQNQLHFEWIILKRGIFQFFLWIFIDQNTKELSKGKVISFLQTGKTLTWFLLSTVFILLTDNTIYKFFFIIYEFKFVGKRRLWKKKAWDFHLFPIRMYISEVNYLYILLKYKQ